MQADPGVGGVHAVLPVVHAVRHVTRAAQCKDCGR